MTTYIVIGVILLVVFAASGGTSGRLRVGKVVEELEARLEPVRQEGPTWMASGKVVRERYPNDHVDFDLRCQGIRHNTGEPSIPNGAELEVVVDDEVVGTAKVSSGHVRFRRRSAQGETVPSAEVGSRVALRYQGQDLLTGVFELD